MDKDTINKELEKAETEVFQPISFTSLRWPLLVILAVLLSMLNIGINVTEDLAERNPIHWIIYLINEFTGVFLIFALLPVLWWFFKRIPPNRFRLWQTVLIYLATSVVFGAVHTSLMYLVRIVVYRWLGLGDYDRWFGVMTYRYAYEYLKQFLFFGVAFLYFLYTAKWEESRRKSIQAARLEQQLAQSRLQFLQMQINPHFLFNTLNMISAEVYTNPEKADKMIALLSDMLRTTLSQPSSGLHTLESELNMNTRYLRIMQHRFGDRLTIDLDCAPETLPGLVPVFLLQPILENAIKFSVDHTEKARVSLSARKIGNALEIDINDNGPGLAGAAGKGIGLHNTLERLEQLYGNQFTFNLQNRTPGGLTVSINMPFQIEKNQPQPA
ncbi:MAG TPA: histidine kinase [Flavilitoribacter sp.]|nr:histidine kinase [Flavilitoribacter sp.]HMQ89834.1 histidine kinase [Flavilitoribacter sp.]